MRAQSGAKSSCRASRARSAISDGIIGALAVRSPWRTKNPRRDDQVGNVARTSGQTRIGAVATNAGADIHGREIQRACCGFGFHPGAGADTSTSDCDSFRMCGGIAERDETAERDAAQRDGHRPEPIEHRIELAEVVVEAQRGVGLLSGADVAAERVRDRAAAPGKLDERRLHPLPAPLHAGHDHDRRPCALIEHDVVSSSASFRSSACSRSAPASCAGRTGSGMLRARGRAAPARSPCRRAADRRRTGSAPASGR